ncbi:MAG TPA: hypothetical protein VL981_03080 [Candidatus Methylacidiphilales bacterium]|nr:hypothetical protein [Candidatus Methylacidiphilales bacterium]
MLVLNEIGAKKEGIHEIIVSNSKEFTSYSDVLEKIQVAVRKHTWNKNHSRHLRAVKVRITESPIVFQDHQGPRSTWIVSVVIQNARPDISASHCSARCLSINPGGQSSNRGFLKVCGHIGYQQLIWPGDMGEFDLLNILADHPRLPQQPRYPSALVPSDLDLNPAPMLFTSCGTYVVTYEVYAENFPRLTFTVRMDVTGTAPVINLV